MAEMIEMQDFAEDKEQIPEENIDEAASDDDSETETAEEQADSEQSETAEPMPEEATQVPEIDYDQFLPILDFSKVSEEEIRGAACNKLLQDSYFGMNGFPVIACFLWAYNKAKNDLDFAKQVCVKSKNFAKAFDYLKKTVMYYRTGGNSGVGMDHRQIFAVLEEYFALNFDPGVIPLFRDICGLSPEEMLAIRWHMSAWDLPLQSPEHKESLNAAKAKSPLVSLVQLSDGLASGLFEWEPRA